MRVILDTNVFVSGVFFSGSPYQILEAWRKGQLELIISLDIFDEYHRVATVLAKQFPPVDLRAILEFIEREAAFFDAPVFRNGYVMIPMMTNFWLARSPVTRK